MASQADLRKQITGQIIEAIESGGLPPWRRPWTVSKNSGRPANVSSKRPYQGVNPLLLELHARKHGFNSRWWGTYRQWQALGAQVTKRPDGIEPGAWGCHCVFFKPITKTTVDAQTGLEVEERFPLLRGYCLFNADQVSGPSIGKYQAGEPVIVTDAVPDYAPAEELIVASKADIRFGGDRAFYVRPVPEGSYPNHSTGDFIQLPPKERYSPPGAFYETALHELAHWSEIRTGWNHAKQGYPLGELAAEIASCYLATELGVPQGEGLENHVSYLKSWLENMRNDPRFIFIASTQASKATDYLLAFVRPAEVESEEETESVVGIAGQAA
jgi:antirestriction protein ArdC